MFDLGERAGDGFLQIARIAVLMRVEIGADLGRDREAGRHRQAEIGPLCVAAQGFALRAVAWGGAVPKAIAPFRAVGPPIARPFGRHRLATPHRVSGGGAAPPSPYPAAPFRRAGEARYSRLSSHPSI